MLFIEFITTRIKRHTKTNQDKTNQDTHAKKNALASPAKCRIEITRSLIQTQASNILHGLRHA